MKYFFAISALLFFVLVRWDRAVLANTYYQITPAIPERPTQKGAVFFSKDFPIIYRGGRLLISGKRDGTGDTLVDDYAFIRVTHPDGSTREVRLEYDVECNGDHIPQPPYYETGKLFDSGRNMVHIELADRCGGSVSSTSLYMVGTEHEFGPPPFLRLPWDYEGKGLSFNDAALAISAYFDHEYPLLSAGLEEPGGLRDSVVTFKSPTRADQPYSSHDGYDYAGLAQVHLGDAVLAAAAGTATYSNSCAACGNMILIDHGNGYQTRYMHLQKDGLITNVPENTVQVSQGQQIGKVGATGHVIPSGDQGAHIHFEVVQDRNIDGNFEDNIPDGVTDPFGWKPFYRDPWEQYVFKQNDKTKQGNASSYIWMQELASSKTKLTADGGTFSSARYKLIFPDGSVNSPIDLSIESSPVANPSARLMMIGPASIITAKDADGNPIKAFLKSFQIIIDFLHLDLSKIDTKTLSIYSSEDGITWTKENTTIDWDNKQASTQVNHLSYFALVGDLLDIQAPTTTAVLTGTGGQNNTYNSDVSVRLNAVDNQGGLGIDYTLYKIDNGDWDTYQNSPFVISENGQHTIEFYSVDKSNNLEELKNTSFVIDKTIDVTPPEVAIEFNAANTQVSISPLDASPVSTETTSLGNNQYKIAFTDQSKNKTQLVFSRKDKKIGARIALTSIQYGNNAPIDLSKYNYAVAYLKDKKTTTIKRLIQVLEVKRETRLKLDYVSRTNKTKIITKEKGQERVKQVVDGMRILKLTTDHGSLKYEY